MRISDWSSDVFSSDLRIFKVLQHAHSPTMRYRKVLRCCGAMFYTAPHRTHLVAGGERYTRHFRILSCRNCNSPLEAIKNVATQQQCKAQMRLEIAIAVRQPRRTTAERSG